MKFVGKFLTSLLTQVGGHDHEELALSLGPTLRKQKTGFDSLSEPNLIGQDRAPRKWIAEGEKSSFNLVRIEIDLGVREHTGQHLYAVRRAAFCQFMRKVFRVEVGEVRQIGRLEWDCHEIMATGQ